MSQSYRKYEITTTFKQEICRNLIFLLRLRQILIINARIKDLKKTAFSVSSNNILEDFFDTGIIFYTAK